MSTAPGCDNHYVGILSCRGGHFVYSQPEPILFWKSLLYRGASEELISITAFVYADLTYSPLRFGFLPKDELWGFFKFLWAVQCSIHTS